MIIKAIGKYDCYEIIGKGSFGKVYKGSNRDNGDVVAIKEISLSNPKLHIELI
jgi:serine/threonine protein kinase